MRYLEERRTFSQHASHDMRLYFAPATLLAHAGAGAAGAGRDASMGAARTNMARRRLGTSEARILYERDESTARGVEQLSVPRGGRLATTGWDSYLRVRLSPA